MNKQQALIALAVLGLGGAGISFSPEIVKMIDDILFSIVQILYQLVPLE